MRRLDFEVARRLTDNEMKMILEGVSAADIPGVAVGRALYGVFDALLGDVGLSMTALGSTGLHWSPKHLRIPEDQWVQIAEHLVATHPADPIEATNIGLDWMNLGPSSYKPGEVTEHTPLDLMPRCSVCGGLAEVAHPDGKGDQVPYCGRCEP